MTDTEHDYNAAGQDEDAEPQRLACRDVRLLDEAQQPSCVVASTPIASAHPFGPEAMPRRGCEVQHLR